MDVIRLLNCKNRCLERFLTASDEFLSKVNSGEFAELENFYKKRDRILKGFDLYDRKLSECLENLKDVIPSAELSQQAAQALAKKELLIKRIAIIDAEIIEAIETEKTRIQREMITAQKSANAVKKFKSGWIPEAGEGLDETL